MAPPTDLQASREWVGVGVGETSGFHSAHCCYGSHWVVHQMGDPAEEAVVEKERNALCAPTDLCLELAGVEHCNLAPYLTRRCR